MTHVRHTLFTLLGLLSLAAAGCKSGMLGDAGDYSLDGMGRPSFALDRVSESMIAGDMAQARELERNGQAQEALQVYAKLAESNPKTPIVWHRMAVAFDKLGMRQNADECFVRALALDPMNAELWADFGYGQFLRGDFVHAEQSCRRAVLINPTLTRGHNNLGLVLAKLGNSAGAIEQFKLAGCDANQATLNLELVQATPITSSGVSPIANNIPIQAPSPAPSASPLALSAPPAASQLPLAMTATSHSPNPVPSPELLSVQSNESKTMHTTSRSGKTSSVSIGPMVTVPATQEVATTHTLVGEVSALPRPVIEPSLPSTASPSNDEPAVPSKLVARERPKSIELCPTGLLPMPEQLASGVHSLLSDEAVEPVSGATTDAIPGVVRQIGDE